MTIISRIEMERYEKLGSMKLDGINYSFGYDKGNFVVYRGNTLVTNPKTVERILNAVSSGPNEECDL